MLFLNQLINGLHLGSIYALIALGYTMVYGIVKLINFAHGDIIMIGAYVSMLMITSLSQSPVLALVASVISCAFVGVVIEGVAYRPLRNAPRISALITAIGVSYLLENVAQLIFGSEPRPFPNPFQNVSLLQGQINLGLLTVVTIVSSALVMLLLRFVVYKTKTGKAMRAVSEDLLAARLMGINVNKTISLTFAIGSALAGFGSFLYSAAYPIVNPYMGFNPGLKAFIAAVLGGIGSVPGAMLGGILMGVIESFSKAYISSQLADAVVYGILILVLLFKPSGILGKPMIEKV